eukprot:5785663-Pyramimonas_sp.AAC.1
MSCRCTPQCWPARCCSTVSHLNPYCSTLRCTSRLRSRSCCVPTWGRRGGGCGRPCSRPYGS